MTGHYEVKRWYEDPDRAYGPDQQLAKPDDVRWLERNRVSTLYAFSPNVVIESVGKTRRVMDSMGDDVRVLRIVAEALGTDRWDQDHWVSIERRSS